MEQTYSTTRCFSCNGLVPDVAGPTHEYMLSHPGCWRLYGEILAKEYMPAHYNPEVHRITVDTYAVQHPGRAERKAIQSVNIHLISLFSIFERGASSNTATTLMRKALGDNRFIAQMAWLEPPSFDGTVTVSDVVRAGSSHEHAVLVRRWGKSVWLRWRDKHGDVVARLVGQLSAA